MSARIIGPVLAMAMTEWALGQAEQKVIETPPAATYRVWPSAAPEDPAVPT